MAVRSWLFVQGDSERKLAKAPLCGADVVIVDLEDAVAPEAKPAARRMAAEWLHLHRRQVTEGPTQAHWVRINAVGSEWWRGDLDVAMAGAPAGIVLPKCSGPDDLRQLSAELYECEQRHGLPIGSTRIMPLVGETPAAALSIPAYAAACANGELPRLAGLTWGAEDLSTALNATRKRAGDAHHGAGEWTDALRMVRATALITAHASGLLAVDTLHSDFRDLAGLASIATASRADGFHGMLAIHPDQVPVINAAFSPTEAELAHAHAIVAAFAANPGAGALSLNGRMIEKPHLVQARHLLGLAG
ncbi:MAG TPA: CoA ester lyase [Sphingomonadaceae bacterium]|nr:CoA ester lyase [Sphingomonadaceae bacterium]